ncbi:response regulator [Sapientia aquatica]|uniref:Response regulator n=1 Tax=Sapientia aquatica TaxID=1549640 RepID=A0A4R5W204_9BURK|nr:response regulator [Sapientia aquatica]TDK66446.1 response regulator [Sapientia aquatica]
MKNTLTILIVDDSEIIRELLKLTLQKLGHNGVMVNNGEEALRCLDERAFDLVLMDVTMPVMDGLSALKLLRQKEQLSNQVNVRQPVILITGNDLPSDLEKFLDAGADGFVSKPVNLEALKNEINNVMAGR